MRNRVIILTLMFLFAWTFPLTHNVEVKVSVGKSLPKQTKATWAQKEANKALAVRYAKAGWGWDSRQRACVNRLFMRESKFDHLADNPKSSAFGIAQILGETSKNPEIQILHAYKYIVHRYRTPCVALNHHLRRNWY